MTDTERIIRLSTPAGFFDEYEKHVKESKTYIDAYERTEQEYQKIFFRRRYSCYDSFRVVYNRRK